MEVIFVSIEKLYCDVIYSCVYKSWNDRFLCWNELKKEMIRKMIRNKLIFIRLIGVSTENRTENATMLYVLRALMQFYVQFSWYLEQNIKIYRYTFTFLTLKAYFIPTYTRIQTHIKIKSLVHSFKAFEITTKTV